MKVYVDGELPKSCDKCKFYECETELVGEWGIEKHRHICKINGSLIQGICPLQSLADYTKQVRKETIDDLAVSLMMHLSKDAEFTVEKICNWLQKAKDQIETE